jgi:hypothetical protein
LYQLARDLSGAVQLDQVVKISDESIENFSRHGGFALARRRFAAQVGVEAGRNRR